MNLQALLGSQAPAIEIAGLTDDSRRVQPGYLFCAVKGHSADGHEFVDDALRRGAVAIISERPLPLVDPAIAVLVRPDLAARRGDWAACFHGYPAKVNRCIGVTGTNGKTSVAWFTAYMLELLGQSAGYMGTVGWGRIGHLQASDSTTAGAIVNQERLAWLLEHGVRATAMEVSSHALDQGRVDGIPFSAAVFTNLTRDHLDYHGTMTDYANAKRKLFETADLLFAVVNVDDEFGRTLVEEFRDRVQLVTYGRKAEVSWSNLRPGPTSIRGRWTTPWGQGLFELPMVGEFSVANAAAALAVLGAQGNDLHALIDAQRQLPPVPGRMQFFRVQDGPVVVVDYAHTPDALTVVLKALRQHSTGELVCVMGCGGDRDKGKRPLMAAVADELADVLWLTSDNPRSEDPELILDAMRGGLAGQSCVYECVDRADAIRRAVACANEGDVILVAGKGHEDYQEFATGRVPFSDVQIVQELVRMKAYD